MLVTVLTLVTNSIRTAPISAGRDQGSAEGAGQARGRPCQSLRRVLQAFGLVQFRTGRPTAVQADRAQISVTGGALRLKMLSARGCSGQDFKQATDAK